MTASLPLTALASFALCLLYRRLARRWRILDVPNERSAHRRPVPRGGGLPLLAAFAAGTGWHLAAAGKSALPPAILALAALLAAAGALDDRRNLAIGARMAGYAAASLAAAWLLLPADASALAVPAALYLLWLLNLYNFMDGIDGIAGLQAVLACASVAVLGGLAGAAPGLVPLCGLLAAACLGFLALNWPRASLFLGDAGSVPLGFLLGCLSLASLAQGAHWLACWLILLAAFVADASVTLCWRVLTGQRFTRPHNLHAYQRLARRWRSHGLVLGLLAAIHCLWLMPLAALALLQPERSLACLALAYAPLVAGVLASHRLP